MEILKRHTPQESKGGLWKFFKWLYIPMTFCNENWDKFQEKWKAKKKKKKGGPEAECVVLLRPYGNMHVCEYTAV